MVTFDNLVTGLNQYAVRTSKEVRTLINTNLEWEDTSRYRPCDESWVEGNADIGDVLQPYQADIRSVKGDSTWSGVETILEDGMVLTKFEQKDTDKFLKTQLYQYRELGKEMQARELYKIVIEKLIVPRLKNNINTSAFAGTGEGFAVAGTPGNMLRTFTGYGKRITTAIAGGKITPAPTGVSTPLNIRTNVRVLCDFVPSWLRYRKGTIKMSTSMRQWYIDRFIADNNYTIVPGMNTDQYAIVPGYNKTIIGCDSMEGSQRMILELDEYPAFNIPVADGMPAIPNLRVTGGQGSDLFTLYVYAPMRRAYGLNYYQVVFVNDQP